MLDTYRAIIGADSDELTRRVTTTATARTRPRLPPATPTFAASIYGIPRGTISGIAPRARVVAYKGLGNLGGFTSDLAAAIDQAVADGVDVINYSVGGGASLTGGDDIAYLFAADAGVFVATSAGNSGPGPGTIGGPATVPWLTDGGRQHPEPLLPGDGRAGRRQQLYRRLDHAGYRRAAPGGRRRLPAATSASPAHWIRRPWPARSSSAAAA